MDSDNIEHYKNFRNTNIAREVPSIHPSYKVKVWMEM